MTRILLALSFVLAFGCGGGGSSSSTQSETASTGGETTTSEPTDTSSRAQLTVDECTARGGTIVGDIGDGATQRPDYVCPNGQPPLGTVASGIEGSACCGS